MRDIEHCSLERTCTSWALVKVLTLCAPPDIAPPIYALYIPMTNHNT